MTGKNIKSVPRITIYPKSHYVTPKDKLEAASATIKEELAQRLEYFRANDKLIEAQRIKERTQYDLEMIGQLGYCNGIENYLVICQVDQQVKHRQLYLITFPQMHCCLLMKVM